MALRRDADPGARFVTDGIEGRCIVALADLGDYEALVRVLNEHEVRSVYHLGAQTIVGTALRSPLSTFDANIRGTYALLEACRSLGDGAVERIVVASTDKAYGAHDELPYREDFALRASYPYDVSKACADLIARSYAATYDTAGRGHALRQRLRPGRRQLVAARARHGARARPRRAARDPLGRHARARLPLRRRCRRCIPGDRRIPGPGGAARPSLERGLGEGRVRARARAQADRGVGSRSSSRTSAAPASRTRRSTASSSTRPLSAASLAGSRACRSTTASAGPGSGTWRGSAERTGGIYSFIALDGVTRGQAMWSIIIAFVVLYILFGERGSREFFSGTR